MENREEGAAAVEMALILPLLLLLLFGIVVFGLHLFHAQSMQAAVREGGRLAAVGADLTVIRDTILSQQQVAPTLADLAITASRGATTVTTGTVCRTSDRGTDVTVTAALVAPEDFGFTIPFFGTVASDFASTAVFRCE